MSYTRFAIYYVPPTGPLATFGASWLGWDVISGAVAHQPTINGLDDITATPQNYGFHGTLKPPFRLADGCDLAALQVAVETLADTLQPAICESLILRRLGRFLALTPTGDTSSLAEIANACVTQLDRFRAPATDTELTRRRAAGLTPRQDLHLQHWGYPYVLDDFRFHLTLTGKLPADDVAHWEQVLRDTLPPLPAQFIADSIALVGERSDGRFALIQRYALSS